MPRRATAVYEPGTPANHVYFLESGLVKIERAVEGNRDILLSVVPAGDLFGEQALTGDEVFSCAARVLESGVAYAIPVDVFHQVCDRRPDMWRLVVQHTLSRLDSLERKIEHLCHSDVRSRLIFYLDELARLNAGQEPGAVNLIHISQNELASLVGATRETTSTTLNTLARQGLISLGHRLVMIPSLDALRSARDSVVARSTAAGQPQA
ncbi:MAG TPA: Crp/Fnr family transcriptional regulator [Bryobacteraceae bacterium]|nr:Crp/Fnr family transcriptional regulator [Bryobacteraceae bacterium]